MNEQNVGNLDVEAILANEELIKKLAAKILDIIQLKTAVGDPCQGPHQAGHAEPNAGGTCQGPHQAGHAEPNARGACQGPHQAGHAEPNAGGTCQGPHNDMAKGDQLGDWKAVCKKKLDSLKMEIEDGLAALVAEDYPLNAEELDQVVSEIKTSETYSRKLSRADLSRAVSKVLADNEIMRRKGSVEAMKVDYEKL